MSLTIKRKQIVAASLAVALAAAMFVNWYYTRPVASAENEPELTSSTQHSANLAMLIMSMLRGLPMSIFRRHS